MTNAEVAAPDQERVNKREYISAVAARAELPIHVVSAVYEVGIQELLETVARGDRLVLTGFGRFYLQAHKGHRVQFADAKDGESPVIEDYSVLKFSARREVNKHLHQLTVEPDAE